MKKVLYALLGFVIVTGIYFAYNILNPKSPLETVSTDDSNISITYSRPYKNDRLIFGEENDGALVPFGVYWRTGANKHTFIETSETLMIGDETLSPGTYSIYTIPNLQSWDVFFNKEVNFFGISRPSSDSDVVSVNALTNNLFNSVWAEPKIDDLSKCMEELYYEDKSKITKKIDKAKLRIDSFTWEKVVNSNFEFFDKFFDLVTF